MTRLVALEVVTSCPLCDHPLSCVQDAAIGGVMTRRVFGPAIPPDVARCADCRTYFRNPRPSPAAVLASYDRGLMYAQWQEQREVRGQLWSIRARLVRAHRAGGSLLDIGTGDGEFLDVARAAGYDVVGTEPSATGARLASARGHDVRTGTLEEIDFGDRRFDLVTVWHVLEHVSRPGNFLLRAHRLLKPGGLLFVAVPNEEWILLPRRLRWYSSRHPLPRLVTGEEIHLTHFQPPTLKGALCRAGFEPIGFGVDDVDLIRTTRTWLKRVVNRGLSAVIGWHLSTAMYAIVRKPVERGTERGRRARSPR